MNCDLCLHMDADDPAMLRLTLKNAANYMKALPDQAFQLVLVANGPAVRQFVTANAEGAAQARRSRPRGCTSGFAPMPWPTTSSPPKISGPAARWCPPAWWKLCACSVRALPTSTPDRRAPRALGKPASRRYRIHGSRTGQEENR